MTERRIRSIAKALSWRTVGTLDTFMLALIVTGDLGAAAGVASLETLTKTALYYGHERLWGLIRFGRCPPQPAT